MARPGPNNPNGEQESPAKTPEVIKRIIEGHKMDFWVQDTCVYAGISKTTYYRRLETDKKLRDEIEAAERYLFLAAKRTLAKGAMENPQMAAQRLKMREKKVYSERTEITGEDGEPITMEVLLKMSDDRLLELAKGKKDRGKESTVIIKKAG